MTGENFPVSSSNRDERREGRRSERGEREMRFHLKERKTGVDVESDMNENEMIFVLLEKENERDGGG